MKFYPIPLWPGPEEALAEFAAFIRMPGNIGRYAAPKVNSAGVIPAEGVGPHPHRDNSLIYNPGASSLTYLIHRGDAILTPRTRVGDAGIPVTDVEGLRQLDGTYPKVAMDFYFRRVVAGDKNFFRIPRLSWEVISASEAGRLNIAPLADPFAQIVVDWPLAIPNRDPQTFTTMNPDAAFRYNPSTGRPEAFSVTEYDREFPLVSGSLGADEFLGAVEGILNSGMTPDEKARAIRLLANK